MALTAFLSPDEIIVAMGGYMLVFSIAMTAGVTTTNTILTTTFKRNLVRDLKVPNAAEVSRDKKYFQNIPLTNKNRSFVILWPIHIIFRN